MSDPLARSPHHLDAPFNGIFKLFLQLTYSRFHGQPPFRSTAVQLTTAHFHGSGAIRSLSRRKRFLLYRGMDQQSFISHLLRAGGDFDIRR